MFYSNSKYFHRETKSLPIGPQQTSEEFFAGHRLGYSAFVSACWSHGGRVHWSIKFSRLLHLARQAAAQPQSIAKLPEAARHRSEATAKESALRSNAKRKLYKAQQSKFEKRQRIIQAGGRSAKR